LIPQFLPAISIASAVWVLSAGEEPLDLSNFGM